MLLEDQIKTFFSHRLKSLMQNAELSEEMLSKEIGISQSAINRIKNGLVCPSLYQAFLVASFFKIKVDELVPKEPEGDVRSMDESKFIPIIDSHLFAKNSETNLIGVIENFDNNNLVGLKVDRSFDCNLFNSGSIMIIDTNQKVYKSNVVFLKSNIFMVGNIHNGYISKIDNLSIKFPVTEVQIIGEINKIETTYIKNPSVIEKLKAALGSQQLKLLMSNNGLILT